MWRYKALGSDKIWTSEFRMVDIDEVEVGKFYLDSTGILLCYFGKYVDTKVPLEKQRVSEVYAKVGCMMVTREELTIIVHDFKLGSQEIQNRILDTIEADKDCFASNLLRVGRARPSRLCAEVPCLTMPVGTMKYLIRQRGLSSIKDTYSRGCIYKNKDDKYYWYLGKLNWSWGTNSAIASLVTNRKVDITPSGVSIVLGKQEDVFLYLGTELFKLTETCLLSKLDKASKSQYELDTDLFKFKGTDLERVHKSFRCIPPVTYGDTNSLFRYSLCI